MRQFIKYLFILLSILIISMIILDSLYTYVYSSVKEPRTKFQFLKSLENKKIDYIFLGSSRVENSINCNQIETYTGKKAVNLGFQASKMCDIFTVLKLLKKYNITYEKVYIQLDYNYNIDGYSNVLSYEMMPFIHDNQIIKQHYLNYLNLSPLYYYVPFYRYMQNGHKIGIRDFFATLTQKKIKNSFIKFKGFAARRGVNNELLQDSLPNQIKPRNLYYDKIVAYCTQNKIDATYYCAPFKIAVKNLDYIDKLKSKVPNLIDYSKRIKNNNMFLDNYHLNEDGANYFTQIIIDDLLLKKSN